MADNINTSSKVPLISNVAAVALTGFITVMVSSWDGRIIGLNNDFSLLKGIILLALPGLSMILAHAIKSIGFRWSLGFVNRQLLLINKKRAEQLDTDIKKYAGILPDEVIKGFKDELSDVIKDRHAILANNFEEKIKEKQRVQEKYTTHQETSPHDNDELKEMLQNKSDTSSESL